MDAGTDERRAGGAGREYEERSGRPRRRPYEDRGPRYIAPEKLGEPSSLALLRHLPTYLDDSELQEQLRPCHDAIARVRIMRDNHGNSKGMAVVYFDTVNECRSFVEEWAGNLQIEGELVRVDYFNGDDADWKCHQCHKDNFKKRSICFWCGARRMEDEEIGSMLGGPVNEGEHDQSFYPSPVLIVRGLDVLTSEESLFEQLIRLGPVLEVRLVKDRVTHTSQGFAFAYFADANISTAFLYAAQNLEIDGRRPTIYYANLLSAGPHVTEYWDTSAYFASYRPASAAAPTSAPAAPPAVPMAAVEPAPAPPSALDVIAPPRASTDVDDSALASFYADVEGDGAPAASSAPASSGAVLAAPAEPAPEPAPLPKLKLDARTGLFVDEEGNTFFRDKRTGQLTLVSGGGGSGAGAGVSEGPLRAADIQADELFTRWAAENDAADDDMADEGDEGDEGDDRGDEHVSLSSTSFIDVAMRVCTLCQRKFRFERTLHRHAAESELHRDNLAQLELEVLERQARKRDRAAERRELHGQPKKPKASRWKRLKPSAPVVSAPAPNLQEDASNVGNRLMQQMGWTPGAGLGRHGTGIAAPVEALTVAPGAGLGSAPVVVAQGETPHERMMRLTRERYSAAVPQPAAEQPKPSEEAS